MSNLPPLDPESRLLIGGELRGASNGATFENIDPATEEVLGECADGTKEDMDAAVAAARRAFDETSWSEDHAFRKKCLMQLHDALQEAKESLRALVVAEAGSPILLTYSVQVNTYIDDLPYWADLAADYPYEDSMSDIQFMGQTMRRLMRREPVGVVGAITPWNFPLYLNLCKLAPALAAGNTVVLKPPPDTPWCATILGRLAAEKTDIPAGVFNVVASSDHMVGEVLTTDPRVDMVTFTGSTATGRRVMEAGAATVKKIFLELGGKSAHVVLDDIDVAQVAGFVGAVCTHAGQGCAIPTRLLLPRSQYEKGVEMAKASFENLNYGDPRDPKNLMGPVVSRKQRERVLDYIEKGEREARLVTGGGIPKHLPKGWFVEPTVFADVDPGATIAQEEIFGPVLAVIPYEDDDDAVRIANNSTYGLSGAVSSGSLERAMSVARRIRTGTMGVNGGMWFAPDSPFGGYKQSGIGREHGIEGFVEYLQTKTIGTPAG